MGLDTVELLMAIEEEFGIHIDDDVATECTTPAHVADYVYTRVRKSENDPCLTQKGFYRLRKILSKTFNVDRNEIKPNSFLEKLLGKDIKRDWMLLQKSLDLKEFPPLKRSKSILIIYVLILPAISLLPLVFSGVSINFVIIGYVLLLLLMNLVTLKFANTIPSDYVRVGSLIPYVECSENKIWDKESILKRIIEITSAQLGIPIEKINNNSHFVHDLGAD